MTASSTISAEEFDRRFDEGEALDEFLDVQNPIVREPDEPRRVSLTMPSWLVDELDAEARHLASTRQSVINMRLADYYESKHNKATA